jgi:hypothetical protein
VPTTTQPSCAMMTVRVIAELSELGRRMVQ